MVQTATAPEEEQAPAASAAATAATKKTTPDVKTEAGGAHPGKGELATGPTEPAAAVQDYVLPECLPLSPEEEALKNDLLARLKKLGEKAPDHSFVDDEFFEVMLKKLSRHAHRGGEKKIQMSKFKDFLRVLKTYDVLNMISNPNTEIAQRGLRTLAVYENIPGFQKFWYGRSKKGHIVTYTRMSGWHDSLKDMTEDDHTVGFLTWLARGYEARNKVCKGGYRALSIVDWGGSTSWFPFKWRILKAAVAQSQLLDMDGTENPTYVINVPSLCKWMFKIMKSFMDKQVTKNLKIYDSGTDYLKKLQRVVDITEIPPEWGGQGKNKARYALYTESGNPWTPGSPGPTGEEDEPDE